MGWREEMQTAINTKATVLKISGNKLSAEDVRWVADQLPLSALKSLEMRGCRMTAEGARHLGPALRKSELIKLDLGAYDNPIGDEGAKFLAEGLPGSKLQELILRACKITSQGARSLLAVLPNCQLISLNLESNNIDNGVQSQIKTALAQRKLQTISTPPNVQTTSTPPNVQTTSTPTKVETTSTQPKVQTPNTQPKVQTTSTPPNVQTTSTPPKVQTTSTPPKVQTPKVDTPKVKIPKVETPNLQTASNPPKVDEATLNSVLRTGNGTCRYLKIVLGGEGRAGKTSTTTNLLGQPFNSKTEATHAIAILKAVLSDLRFDKDASVNIVKQGLIDALDSHSKTTPRAPASKPQPPATAPKQSELSISSTVIAEHPASMSAVTTPTNALQAQNSIPQATPSYLGKFQLDDEVNQAARGSAADLASHKSLIALFYDCGGQDVYQTANELFFTPQSIVLLVFDLQQTLQLEDVSVLKTWCDNISLHTPSSPIILVGTHADKVGDIADYKRVSEMLRTQLGDTCAWQNVVNKSEPLVFVPLDNTVSNGADVVRLRKLIVQVARDQPYMKEEYPVRWLQCLDAIMEIENPILTMSEFTQQIASRFHVKSDEIDKMLGKFHDLGFIARYNNDPKLSDYLITKPQFIIDAIGAVICGKGRLASLSVSQSLRRNYCDEAVLDDRLLVELLERAGVSDPTLQNIVRLLLQRFDLMCELHANEMQNATAQPAKYLVPSMLPKRDNHAGIPEPCHTAHFYLLDKKGNRVFPLGAFYRLICKAFRWSQLTNSDERILALHSAVLAFGAFRVKLAMDLKNQCVQVLIGAQIPGPTFELLEHLLKEICEEVFFDVETEIELEVTHQRQKFVKTVRDVRNCFEKKIPITINSQNQLINLPSDLFSPWVNSETLLDFFHVFFSYRVEPDATRARLMYDCFSKCPVEDSGKPPAVFLDVKCLLTGHQWDVAFAKALRNSMSFVALITAGSLKTVHDRAEKYATSPKEDNVLLEWQLALELHKRGVVKVVVQLMENEEIRGQMRKLPSVVNQLTNDKCIEFLQQLGINVTDADRQRIRNQTVNTVATELLRFQALTLSQFASRTQGKMLDWELHMKCAKHIVDVIVKPELEKMLAAQGNSSNDDVKDLLEENGFGDLYEALKKFGCHNRATLFKLSAAAIPKLLDTVKLEDDFQRSQFCSMVQTAQLEQTIDGWLKTLKLEKYLQGFQQQNCDTFELLFNCDDAEELNALLVDIGMQERQKNTFMVAVAKKRAHILGN